MRDAGRAPKDSGGTSKDSGGTSKDSNPGVAGHDAAPDDAGDTSRPVRDFSHSVLERNKRASRDGAYVEPTFTLAAVPNIRMEAAFAAMFKGQVYASPLFLEAGPGGKGVFFAVTSSNDVFAFAETSGSIVWRKNLGSAPAASGTTCGTIRPIGAISTPVIDAEAGTIYLAGAAGTTAIERHEVHALSVIDGSERPGYPIVVGGTSNNVTFTPLAQNQHGALSLVNGVLYVPYGGHNGDCGSYHGWVFAVDTRDPKKRGVFATLGQSEGIWAPGGMASDGNGVFAITGNHPYALPDHMFTDSEEVLRITGLATLNRTTKNVFFPSNWPALDSSDLDLGASSAVYTAVPGSAPAHVLALVGKNGTFYLLDPMNLGGMDGHLAQLPVSTGITLGSLAAYQSKTGTHVLLTTVNDAVCKTTNAAGRTLTSVLIAPGAPPKARIAWCAPMAGSLTGAISTTTDGMSNSVVWLVDNDFLMGYDGDTGATVYAGKERCVGVRQGTSAIVARGRIVAGADDHLCVWSLPH